MSTYNVDPIQEIAPTLQYTSENVQYPEYGRLLEDFSEGEVFIHPRAFTIDRSFAQEFATVFHDACPLFLSAPYAQANGFRDLAVPPLMVFNIALCLGVQNNSEKAVANLGYYNVLFTQPVYPGDTLTARSKVISRRERGEGKPGIVHVKTLCMNQSSRVVLQYERKIMIAPRGSTAAGGARASHDFPELTDNSIELPDYSGLDAAFIHQT
ncbi:MAG: MaoC family dehydratase, partial [Leptospiraceae bacterium]|nr:MaoC family dehydratase [Leptospiraceae bacterium]